MQKMTEKMREMASAGVNYGNNTFKVVNESGKKGLSYISHNTEKINKAKEIVKETFQAGGGATVVTYVALIPVKFALGASVPYLMSAGATVVKGVGSIMPWWIGPIQAASTVGFVSLVTPAVIVGGTVAIGYGGYRCYCYYYDDNSGTVSRPEFVVEPSEDKIIFEQIPPPILNFGKDSCFFRLRSTL